MKQIVFASSMALLVLVIGCSTSYNPAHSNVMTSFYKQGYSEIQLAEDTYKVSFHANAYTDESKATDYCLLRCADVTIENGFKYFAIIQEKRSDKLVTINTPTVVETTGQGTINGQLDAKTKILDSRTSQTTGTLSANEKFSSTSTIRGGQPMAFVLPRPENTIVCFKEKVNINGILYDPVLLRKSIREKHNIK